jgi:hypothetical protein
MVKPSQVFWLAIHISSHIIICVHHMPEATSIIRNPEFQRPSLDTGLGVLSLILGQSAGQPTRISHAPYRKQ